MTNNTTERKRPSQDVCDKFLEALLKQRCIPDDEFAEIAPGNTQYKPKLVMDFDWLGTGAWPSIVWEDGGPFEWAYYFPYGGREEEYGMIIKDVSSMLPPGWYAEPITSWSMGIYEI